MEKQNNLIDSNHRQEKWIAVLTDKLRSIDINYATLTALQKKQVVKVFKAIQSHLEALEDAKESIKANKFSVASLADECHISRPTMYNNPMLNHLATDAMDKYAKGRPDYNMESVKTENNQLREEIDALISASIEKAELQLKINTLEKELKTVRKKLEEIRDTRSKNYMETLKEKPNNKFTRLK